MKDRNEIPKANEFGQIRAWLAQAGVSQSEITAVIGNGADGRSRAEIASTLRDWMSNLPKTNQ